MTVVAVDVGGSKVAAAEIGDDGAVLGRVSTVRTAAQAGSDAVVGQVVGLVQGLVTARVTGVAISAAGVVDSLRGVVLGSTDTIAGWRGTALGPRVSAAVALPVTVLGDGHAFAVGAAAYGEAARWSSALVLAVGTGIGGSFVTRGRPHFGEHWAAGHLGHVPAPGAEGIPCSCGRSGHLEAIAGGAGMVRLYRHLGGSAPVTSARDVFALEGEDPVADEVVRRAAGAIGSVTGGLANTLDPGVVVIAGGIAQVAGQWSRLLREAYEKTLMPVIADTELIVAAADEWLALRGAAHFSRGGGHDD